MICEKCGQQLTDDSRFCTSCGAKIETAEAVSETAAVSESSATVQEEVPEVQEEAVEQPQAAVEEPAKPEPVRPVQPTAQPQAQAAPKAPVQPQAQPVYKPQAQAAADPKKTAPLPVWKFIGIFLLTCIPILGAIMIIVWTFGSSFNKNTQNYARAVFILFILSFILSIVGVIMYWDAVKNIIEYLNSFSGTGF